MERDLPARVRSIRPANMAKAINSLWKKDKRPFTFSPNSNGFYHYGEDTRHSPPLGASRIAVF